MFNKSRIQEDGICFVISGGTLINYEDHIRLLEIAQVPPDHVDEFKSVKKFKIFNTNNLWIRLDEMNNIIKSGRLELEVKCSKRKFYIRNRN